MLIISTDVDKMHQKVPRRKGCERSKLKTRASFTAWSSKYSENSLVPCNDQRWEVMKSKYSLTVIRQFFFVPVSVQYMSVSFSSSFLLWLPTFVDKNLHFLFLTLWKHNCIQKIHIPLKGICCCYLKWTLWPWVQQEAGIGNEWMDALSRAIWTMRLNSSI